MKLVTTAERYQFIKRLVAEHPDVPRRIVSRAYGISVPALDNWLDLWKAGKDRAAYSDHRLSDERYAELLCDFRFDYTAEFLPHLVATEVVKKIKSRLGPWYIGPSGLNPVLSNHFGRRVEVVMEGSDTLSRWLEGRHPRGYVPGLLNKAMVGVEIGILETELTAQHWKYHAVRKIADGTEKWFMDYERLSRRLGEPPERLRNWARRGRGPPFAKVFRDNKLVDVIMRLLNDADKSHVFRVAEQASRLGPEVRRAVTYAQNLYTGGITTSTEHHIRCFFGGQDERLDGAVEDIAAKTSADYLLAIRTG